MLNGEQIVELQQIVRKMPVSDHVFEHARQLVRVTRVTTDEALPMRKKWTPGCGSTRGIEPSSPLRMLCRGQVHVGTEKVAAMAAPVLRHRIIPNFRPSAKA